MEARLQGKSHINIAESAKEDAEVKKYELNDPLKDFSPKKIKKILDLFIESPNKRFSRVYLRAINPDGDEVEVPCKFYHNNLERDFTITDLIFIAAKRIVPDKHVYLTRFPVESHQSIYPSKIKILTTKETTEQEIGSEVFGNYPVIHLDYPTIYADNIDQSEDRDEEIMPLENTFKDTVSINHVFLEALGGDFDGKNQIIAS